MNGFFGVLILILAVVNLGGAFRLLWVGQPMPAFACFVGAVVGLLIGLWLLMGVKPTRRKR